MAASSKPAAIAAIGALWMASLAGCSGDDSGGGEGTNLTPFGFLAGNYGVGVSPGFANCTGQVYFPQEVWMVATYLAAVSVLPTPDASNGPLPVGGTTPPDSGGSGQALPPTFSGVMSSTLHWSASIEQFSTTAGGCLERSTTVLDVQFTPDGHFAGSRSIFHEYAGGAECPSECRMQFSVQGAKIAR